MRSTGRILENIYLFIRARLFSWREERQVQKRYPTFQTIDQALKLAYHQVSPYALSRNFLQQKGEREVDTYGETPLSTLAHIAQQTSLSAGDRVVELGCGRARSAFFLSHLYGCPVRGIDWVPSFISSAQAIAAAQNLSSITFTCEDFLQSDLEDSTYIYLAGTCLQDQIVTALAEKLAKLSSQPRIVTISYPLSDYNSQFETLQAFPVGFPWGQTIAYCSKIKSKNT